MTQVMVVVAILMTALSTSYCADAYAEPQPQNADTAARERAQSPPLDIAPDFQFTDLNGQEHRLSDWTRQGKYVLLNFWAPWCPYCREEMPLLLDLQKRYADQGLQIIGPAVDRQRDPVADYVAVMDVPYPIFYSHDRVIALRERYGDTTGALPYSVLIAPDGRILARHAGRLTEAMAARWMHDLDGKAETDSHSIRANDR